VALYLNAAVTYNFDPDRWLTKQRSLLEQRHEQGLISAKELQAALTDLERRYDEMLDRLDGTYEIPDQQE
jgi:hypothetical protein